MSFDAVADFIAFVPAQLKRDYRLFKEKTKQFIYISSASAYKKPLSDYRINEGTPLANPYWGYSRNKIAGENYLMKLYRENGFPATIVRPSHTYDKRHPSWRPWKQRKLCSHQRQACYYSWRLHFSLNPDPQYRFCQGLH